VREYDDTFGPPADRTGKMHTRGNGRPPRQNKTLEGFQARFKRIDLLFKAVCFNVRNPADPFLLKRPGGGEIGTQDEQLVLNPFKRHIKSRLGIVGPDHADYRVQLVRGAVRFDA
jgi:hypothetical protein